MNLVTIIPRLNSTQLNELHETMTSASLAYELGGDFKKIFRAAKHRKIGMMRRIYERLENCDIKQIEAMSKSLGEL